MRELHALWCILSHIFDFLHFKKAEKLAPMRYNVDITDITLNAATEHDWCMLQLRQCHGLLRRYDAMAVTLF